MPTMHASTTVFVREFDLDNVIVAVVDCWCPTQAGAPGGTSGLLCLPIDGKVLGVESFLGTGLPAQIWSRRAQQIDLVVLLAGDQQFGI